MRSATFCRTRSQDVSAQGILRGEEVAQGTHRDAGFCRDVPDRKPRDPIAHDHAPGRLPDSPFPPAYRSVGHAGLAALYIGFSVTYGHRVVAWADTRFAHRFTGGPAGVKATGWQYTKQCWGDLAWTLAAALIAAALLAAITWWVGDPTRTDAFAAWYGVLGMIVAVEFLWALSYTIWPRNTT